MRTAVQLRSDAAVRCELLCGEPASIASGTLGPIAIFEPHQIVAYLVRRGISRSLFVFRTVAGADRLSESVPGVHPAVGLLVHVRSIGRVRALRRLLGHIARRGIAASRLSDGFFVRVSCALGGRTDQACLRGLLQRELTVHPRRRRAPALEGRS